MTYDDLFAVCNFGVLPFWALLIFLPQARVTQALVHSALLPAVLGVAYVTFLGIAITSDETAGGFGSLAGVMAFFTLPVAALAGWIHYLVFDLFVGAWAARDAQRHGMPRWAVVPVLLLTLMAGPAGLLLYVIIKAATRNRWALAELAAA